MTLAGAALCRDDRRKAVILDHPLLNGLDFVEYDEDPAAPAGQRYRLSLTFLKAPPAGLTPADIAISGGVRITGIKAVTVGPADATAPPNTLWAFLDGSGDFSTYTVAVRSASLDEALAEAPFSFKAGCPTDLDCRVREDCPEQPLVEPRLDYLAKDYASFRRLLLDYAQARNPRWQETSPADLGVALAELFAYVGDQLSYFQDAVANEAYLDTCRHRVSARRHARLIDYRMHDGRNAWTFVHLEAEAASTGVVPQGTRLLTRIAKPLRAQPVPPGPELGPLPDDAFDADPALADPVVFEATARVRVDARANEILIHTLGDKECCLPRGTTRAFLYGLEPASGGLRQAYRPPLAAGDFLLLEEVKGVVTGAPPDADPSHRQVVRLVAVDATEPATPPAPPPPLVDQAFLDTLLDTATGPVLRPVKAGDEAKPRLPLLQVVWRDEDALAFPLCLSAQGERGEEIAGIAVARGNVVPCDHGRTVVENLAPPEDDPLGIRRNARLALSRGPLTFQAPDSEAGYDAQGRPLAGRYVLDAPPEQAVPAVVLSVDLPGGPPAIWQPVPDLLESDAFGEEFVAEVDDDGLAVLRFGDDQYGRSPVGASAVSARYRIGNGTAGNVGAASLVHVVRPDPADMADPADPGAPVPPFPDVRRVYQPVAARGGVEPETIERVRELAPAAMHAVQFRAVTEADWEQAALTLPGVADAKCVFRWTGSWHTVFVAIHPSDPADLITEPGGRTLLAAGFADAITAGLTRYKLAGYDLQLETAQYVPLKLSLQVCVATGHFRGAVLQAVLEALSNRQFRDGRVGFFAPERLRFGEAVWLSQIYAVLQAIGGVSSVLVTEFRRYWMQPNGELESGVLPLGSFEIARLDNDPSLPEDGVLALTAVGGL